MICPKCGADTPLQKTFCVHCGGFLELDRAEVRDALASEALSEAQLALARRAGTWLAVSLALLAGAIAFRVNNWEDDLPRFDEAPVLPVLALDPNPPEIPPVPIPLLALPVPAP